jgi:guanine deaminase
MATVNGAKAAGFDRLGKLKEGWRADIVGLSTETTRATPLYDPLSHLVFAARGTDVTFTMVDGIPLMEDGEVMVADAAAIRSAADDVAESLDLAEAREKARS